MAALLDSGGYDRHIRRSRLRYRQRRDTLRDALRTQVPHVRVAGIAAGLHVTVLLPAGVAEDDVIDRARHHGLVVEGLQAYSLEDRLPAAPALVIGYATPPDHAYDECLRRLVVALHESGA